MIISLAGTSGSGKSTISREISQKLDFQHHLGSGFIREMVKPYFDRDSNPCLYNYSFRPHVEMDSFENLTIQSKIISPSIEASINRADREKTDIIIEGVNCIPGIIDSAKIQENYNFIKFCKAKKLKILTWTVNNIKTINACFDMGVHGIITDEHKVE